jgi:ABC-type branched-subunit amino acid transport system ATPase component
MLLLDEPMAGMNLEEKAGHVPLRDRLDVNRPDGHYHCAD